VVFQNRERPDESMTQNDTDIFIPSDDEIKLLVSELAGFLPENLQASLKKSGIHPEETLRLLSLSKKFNAEREKRKLSLKEIAQALKVPQYRIKDIEAGRVKTIDPAVLAKCSHYLGIEVWCKTWALRNEALSKKLKLTSYFEAGEQLPENCTDTQKQDKKQRSDKVDLVPVKHKWQFPRYFRKNIYGWKSSQLAARRIKEALSEIKRVARKNPILAAEGAVRLLEKISPALEQIDSSSGMIGNAVNHAIENLVPVINKASADDVLREKWLNRLWKAVEEDEMPYIEYLPEFWGQLCQSPERASKWADYFIDELRLTWKPSAKYQGYFKGTSACLSALFEAGRHEELLSLLKEAPTKSWHNRKWGVKALLATGKKAAALRYAEETRGLNQSDLIISEACEEILLLSGFPEEAYQKYAIAANQKTSYLATFRAIAKKYPEKEVTQVLSDLTESTPGEAGKWFAAAKSVALYEQAIALARQSPCDPRTLTRAARDMAVSQPKFAAEAGIAALYWMTQGYGYELTGEDVLSAYQYTLEAASNAGIEAEVTEHIRAMIQREGTVDRFVKNWLKTALP